jgi:MFS family permease
MNKLKTYKLYELKSFLILWAGQSVSSLGSEMTKYALIVWAYTQLGTVSSITWLAVCSYLPSIVFCFAAGALADKWDKKKVMLISDLIAALGTMTVLFLYATESLQLWHLYIVNIIISFMHAFQNPASYVAVSLLAPKDQYTRVSGLQAFSNSLVTIVTPALATTILSFLDLKAVFIIDLVSFVIAFSTLFLFIKIPNINYVDKKEKFIESCGQGIKFLKENKALWRIILFFSFINLLASISGNSIMPALILARTDNNKMILGMVSSAIGVGTLIGSILVTIMKPAEHKTKVIFLSCAISFLLCDILWATGRIAPIWIFAAFSGNLPLPFLSANLTTIMRTKVPIEMQGRVFAARDTFQFITIPIGLALGGMLADYIFEPFMLAASPIQHIFSLLVGTGKGSGMAVIFLITGTIGFIVSMISLKSSIYKELDY